MEKAIFHHTRAKIQDYVPIVGRSAIEELRALAERLSGKVIQNINSTFTGGGRGGDTCAHGAFIEPARG